MWSPSGGEPCAMMRSPWLNWRTVKRSISAGRSDGLADFRMKHQQPVEAQHCGERGLLRRVAGEIAVSQRPPARAALLTLAT